ncbi:Protein Daple [Liparis tanakae]|uniref:Protein Daple n=1 Tax=Liparis tanakae TaxID=230148 RepID=A0A4Z2GHD5_9TELE|nr:Protein Daple [Liparis tanakae]
MLCSLFSPKGYRLSPKGYRLSPKGYSPKGYRLSPKGYRLSPKGYRPKGYRLSPKGYRLSPKGYSPKGYSLSPKGYRLSPKGYSLSPKGYRLSPKGYRLSPKGYRLNPKGYRLSPKGYRLSPKGYRLDDHTRVRLQLLDGDPHSDYINANYIDNREVLVLMDREVLVLMGREVLVLMGREVLVLMDREVLVLKNQEVLVLKDREVLVLMDRKVLVLKNQEVLVLIPYLCEEKDAFIQQIQSLDIETQAAIASSIQQNRSLQAELRGMRALRDELDCTRERAARSEQLQAELQSCRHRLSSLERTRTQLKEQQQLCAALQETKVLLEEQLADAGARCSSTRELERENLLLRHTATGLEEELDTEKQRVDELLEMNMSLEAELRRSSGGPAPLHGCFLQSELDSDEELRALIDQTPLSVEVGEASRLMLLGAEQENAALRRRLEELQQEVRGQGQRADSPDAKDELVCMETEHQSTLREFQNMKSENATLMQRLEQLGTKLQQIEDERKEEEEEEEEVERGVQGSESCRGEGEGRVRMMRVRERRGEHIVTQREAGVGEEILHIDGEEEELCDEEVESKRRGEAEGRHKEKEEEIQMKKERTALGRSSEIQHQPQRVEHDTEQAVCPPSGPDVELLTRRLQEAQEEADRRAAEAQDLPSELGEQSRRSWGAEQRLEALEAERQRLKEAAEGLGDAHRQVQLFFPWRPASGLSSSAPQLLSSSAPQLLSSSAPPLVAFCWYKELLDGKSQLEERELQMKKERKELEAEAQRRLERERELERLRDDNER